MTNTTTQPGIETANGQFGRGLALAVFSNMWWGFSPIFWKQLSDVAPTVAVAQRVVWTVVLLVIVQTVTKGWERFRAVLRNPRDLRVGLFSSAMLFANWLVFVWAVGDDRVTESALGYFLMPLVSVLFGRSFFGEHLRKVQWLCIGIVATGVIWLTIELGRLPWVALVLGLTFAVYGALRKQASFGAIDGLSLEVTILGPLMLGYLTYVQFGDTPSITTASWGTTGLFVLSGVVTGVPLMAFAQAVRSMPLSLAGLVQYINPTLQFLVGVLIYKEAFEGGQIIGYVIVWIGLAIFALDSYRSASVKTTN